jgi:Tol biopolymer transport system component
MRATCIVSCLLIGLLAGCEEEGDRPDGAYVLVQGAGSLQNPCVSADGGRVVFTRFNGGFDSGPSDLVVLDLEDGSIVDLLADGANNVNHPGTCWGGDDDEILFHSDRAGGEPQVYRISPDGGEPVAVTVQDGERATAATWIVAGEWIVYLAQDADEVAGGLGGLALIAPDGSGQQRIHDESLPVRHPTASPADNLIAYELEVDGVWTLQLVDPTGSIEEELTSGEHDDRSPAFSGDGQRVVFSSRRDGQPQPDLYTVSVGPCEISRLTESAGADTAGAFTPDDSFALFQTSGAEGEDSELWYIPVPGG